MSVVAVVNSRGGSHGWRDSKARRDVWVKTGESTSLCSKGDPDRFRRGVGQRFERSNLARVNFLLGNQMPLEMVRLRVFQQNCASIG